MAARDEIVAYADELLDVGRYPEYGPPGLQVVGAAEVAHVACGVSSSRELFERAVAAGAGLVLVHHGLFWRNEPLVVDARLRGRLEALFAGDASLAAYHLPLDAHPEIGNNVLLARELGVEPEAAFADIGTAGRLREPCSVDAFVARVRERLGAEPLVFPHGPATVERVAISTGSGGPSLLEAGRAGFDLFLTGEPEEPALHTARELGLHFVAAGHYATERLGVQALAARLADRFDVTWEFLEVPNPV